MWLFLTGRVLFVEFAREQRRCGLLLAVLAYPKGLRGLGGHVGQQEAGLLRLVLDRRRDRGREERAGAPLPSDAAVVVVVPSAAVGEDLLLLRLSRGTLGGGRGGLFNGLVVVVVGQESWGKQRGEGAELLGGLHFGQGVVTSEETKQHLFSPM